MILWGEFGGFGVVMRRDLRQMSFGDGPVNQRAGRNGWLGEIDKVLDWAAIAAVLGKIYNSDEGRPSYPVLTLVKLLLLQQWRGTRDSHIIFRWLPSGSGPMGSEARTR
jgi:hypothetical protein